jgi:outer membrane protein insertion porin family
VLGTYREPGVFHTSADAYVAGMLEQQIRSSFNFARRSATVEIARHVTRNVSLSGSYQIQRTRVFDERFNEEDRLWIDRLFPQFRLSLFQSSLIRDTRDDPVDPSTGHYLSANAQLAMRAIGSEVEFVKSFLTAQAFRVVPRTNRVVFAADARVGLAHGFNRTLSGQETEQLPASERFFAGGDTTVRGYALDTLGSEQTIDKNGFPIGGNGLVILNAELRAPIAGGLGIVGFFDTGNVFARVTDIDFGELRSAVGFGLRYKSPVGPLRIDLGFKLNRRELTPGRREALTALHVSFGQAF